jgi:hypothetical protein
MTNPNSLNIKALTMVITPMCLEYLFAELRQPLLFSSSREGKIFSVFFVGAFHFSKHMQTWLRVSES